MLLTIKNHLRERVQAVLSQHQYTAVPFLRAAKEAAECGMLELMRATHDGSPADKAFAEFALLHSRDSYSQWQQECFALWVNDCKRDGVFVEFGAADGVTHSNTHMLEAAYGWTGVLIEPLPWTFRELKRRRPQALALEAAVDPSYSASPKPVQIVSAGQYSSIETYKDLDKHANTRANRRVINVKTINLNQSLPQLLPDRRIDFMSIDVEGPELDIITGFDFEGLDVRCLTVEVNDRDEDAARICGFLEARGYRQPFSRAVTRGDLWFMKNA